MINRLLIIFFVFALLSACAQLKGPEIINPELQQCQSALSELDRLSSEHTGTLIGERLPKASWLRSNRLTEHYMKQTNLSDAALIALLSRMSDDARTGLLLESTSVPEAQRILWQERYNIHDIAAFIEQCSHQLVAEQLHNIPATRKWLSQLPQDNDYSTTARVAGLYPLSALLFREGVVAEQHRLSQLWQTLSDSQWTAYAPASPADSNLSRSNSGTIDYRVDALGLPVINATEKHRLLNKYAPTWLLNSASAANIPGQPEWQQKQLIVNPSQPTIYSYLSLGLFQDKPLLQLNYVAWFTERPAESIFDLLSGNHDAVIFRVNLDLNSRIVAFDSVHLCGCWYTLILPEEQNWNLVSRLYREPVLAYRVTSAPRMAIFLQADTHQIAKITPATKKMHTYSYQQLPFTTLLQLPDGKNTKPVFNNRGYVSGSERSERWFFWPMGIKNAGALRRPGDHAINFVGKRYFDEPQLLEKLGVSSPRND